MISNFLIIYNLTNTAKIYYLFKKNKKKLKKKRKITQTFDNISLDRLLL